jgi:Mediator complex subunit MED14
MAGCTAACLQAPIHDVPTAAEVLETGGYRSLPAAIEQLRPAPQPPAMERAAALRLMDQMLRARLLQVGGRNVTAKGSKASLNTCAAWHCVCLLHTECTLRMYRECCSAVSQFLKRAQ